MFGPPLESFLGVHSAREIPVPIPNTEVKPGSGDYTALRETSKMPNYMKWPPQRVAFHLSGGKFESHHDRGGFFVAQKMRTFRAPISYNEQAR